MYGSYSFIRDVPKMLIWQKKFKYDVIGILYVNFPHIKRTEIVTNEIVFTFTYPNLILLITVIIITRISNLFSIHFLSWPTKL